MVKIGEVVVKIIKIINFGRMEWGVFVVGKKDM
jgi:hypothetical protein